MEYSEEDAIQKIDELFNSCVAQHRLSYPASSINFDQLNMTDRVTQGKYPFGRGHFSDVYKGTLDTKTVVAIKVLRLPAYSSQHERLYESTLLRFFREINNWAVLNHINIARMLGFTRDQGNLGLVALWYPKGNLVQYLHNKPDASKADLALDVAEGVQYLHTLADPLVHSDLKGVNVFINEHGIAHLGDFGISKQLNDLNRKTGFTTTSGTTGTVPWMSLELLTGGIPTFSSDMYSCGGVFLEIWCPGKTPYHYIAQESDIVMAKFRSELPDRQYYLEMRGLDWLWDIMASCWHNDPKQRPDIRSTVQALYSGFELSPRLDNLTTSRLKTRSARPRGGEDVRISSVQSVTATLDQLLSMPSDKIPSEYKKRGKDWLVVCNPRIKQVLDVNFIMPLDHIKAVRCARFSRDGIFIATGHYKTAQIFDTRTGDKICVLPHKGTIVQGDLFVLSVCFSPDGKLLATLSEDNAIRIWDINVRAVIHSFATKHQVGKEQNLKGYFIDLSGNGGRLVCYLGDTWASVWDMQTYKETIFAIPELDSTTAHIVSVALSPEGDHLVTGCSDGIIRIWDVPTAGIVGRLVGHVGSISSIGYTPNGKGLVSGGSDRSLKFWEVAGKHTSSASHGEVAGGASGKHAILASELELKVPAASLVISPNCQWIVCGSLGQGVQFWDPSGPHMHTVLVQDRRDHIQNVCISPGLTSQAGGMFATWSDNYEVRLWKYDQVPQFS